MRDFSIRDLRKVAGDSCWRRAWSVLLVRLVGWCYCGWGQQMLLLGFLASKERLEYDFDSDVGK